VQIYDCIGADFGALTNATIEINGNTGCGPLNVSYDSGNINSAINDNSCNAGTASVFVVPQDPNITTPITLTNTITSVQWSSGGTNLNTTIDPAPTTPTWYYFTATDNFGCTATDSVLFTPDSLSTPNISSNDESCDGQDDGTATATPVDGVPGYDYLWTPGGQTTQTATGLAPDDYSVLVTDNNGCTGNVSVTINPGPVITAGFTQPTPICLGDVFNFTNTGTTGVTYSWDFGDGNTSTAENPSHTYLTANTFTIIQTVSSGVCSETETFDIVVNPNPVPTASSDSVNCNGATDGSVTVTGITGTSAFPAGYGYSWNPSGQTTQTTTSTLGIGVYTVTVQDLTTTCTGQTTAEIFQPVALSESNTPTNPSCASGTNGSIVANPSGGTGAYTYSWAPGGQTSQTATGLSAGILYTCTITDHNNCQITTSATLVDPPGMVLDTSTTLSNCGAADGSATVTVTSGGSGNFTYSWNTTPVQTTATAIGIPAGPYTATVTDVTLGCTSTISAVVPSTSAITANITLVNDALCNGDSSGVAFATSPDGAPTLSFLWDDSGATTNDTLVAIAGTYNVAITDGNGCNGTAAIVIGEPTAVIASITASADETCLGANNGTATAGGAQGTGGYTYLWMPGGQTTATATGLAPNTYTAYVYDDNLCVDSVDVVIGAGPLMTASHDSSDVTCFNGTDGTIDLTINGAPGAINYLWTPGGSVSEDPIGLTAGMYYVAVTSGGCSLNDTVVINEPTQVVAAIDSLTDAACFGDNDGVAYGSASGGYGPYTYLWNDGLAQTTATASSLLAGNYILTVMDSNNCPATVPVVIGEPAALAANSGSLNAYCGVDQGSVWVEPTNGTAPYTFTWDSAGTVLSTGIMVGTSDTLPGLFPGDYAINLTDANGCKYGPIVVQVIIDPGGIASISDSTDVSCFGGSNGTATVSVGGAYPGYTYLWDAAAGSQTVNPAVGLAMGTYNVVVTDTFGCQMPTSVTINQPDSLTVTFALDEKFCPDSCNGSANALPAGGIIPYTYQWNDPSSQIAQSAINLCSGMVSVTVTDGNDCLVIDSISISNPPKMVLTSGTDSSSCNQADGSAYVNVLSNGTAPFTYEWTDATSTVVSTDSTLIGVVAGTYYGFAYDSLGCSVIDTVTIYDQAAPKIDSLVTSNVLCFGGNTGTAEVYVSGGASPYTYSWDAAAGGQITPLASNLLVGGYVVSVTDTNGCLITSPANITEPDELLLTSGGVNPSCTDSADGSVWVNAQGGTMPYSYEWNSNPTLSNDTIYDLPEIVGGYTVTVTDTNNCTEIANVVLVDPALFTIDVSGVNVDCAGSNTGSATVSENNGISPFTYLWDDLSVQTTQTASGLIANTYNVTATDDAGCKADGSIIITEPDTLVISLDTVGHVSCNGLANGYAEVSVIGGSGAYAYEWILGATTVSIQQNPIGLVAGIYNVIVTDTAGCTDQINVEVTQPDVLLASVIESDAKCHNQNSGFAYVTNITGGTAPYSYQWDDLGLQQTDTAFNLLAGNYTVDVTDSLGCQVLGIPVVIDQPDSILLVPSTVSSTCGASNGNAAVVAAGGTPLGSAPFYNYVWNSNPSQGNAVATGLAAGPYQVIVTDANGCQDSIIANITDLGSPTIVMDSITNVSCFGAADGLAYASVSGGTSPYQYIWDNTNADTTLTATNLDAQTYTVTVTDSNGCIASADTIIAENAGVAVIANLIQDVSCNGGSDGSIYAVGNGGTGQATLTYSWNSIPAQLNDTAFNLTANTYTVTVTDLNNCKDTASVVVAEPDLLVTTLDSLKNATCFGDANGYLDVSIDGGNIPYTYAWTPNVSTGPTASGLVFGDYYVIVEDLKGCTDSTYYSITQPNELIVAEVTTASTCGNFNGSAEVTSVTGGTAPYFYNWNDPLNQQTPLADTLLANNYTVIVTDLNGCSVDTTVQVIDTPGPTIDSVIVVDPLCNGDLTGTAEVYASGNGPMDYAWTPSGQTTALASNLGAGVYSVSVTDINFCVATQSGIVVNEPAVLTADITMPSTACYGQEVQLYGVGGGGTPFSAPQEPYDIIWLAPFNTTGAGPFFDTVLTNFTYNVVVQDANGCIQPYSEDIIAGAPLTLFATGDTPCLGDTADVSATAGGGLVGGTYEYTWMVYDSLTGTATAPSGIVNPTSSSNVNVYATDTTDYIVTVDDGCSRPAMAGLTVNVMDTTVITITSSAAGCPIPDYWSVGLEAAVVSGDTTNTYTWLYGDSQSSVSMNDSVSHNYYNSGVYTVQVDVLTSNGCPSTFTFVDEVTVYQVPVADFDKDPFVVTMLNPTYDFLDLSSADVQSWNWDFGDLTTDLINQNPTHTYQDTGFYPVTLIVTNGLCEDTVTKIVQVKPEFLFIMPNTFTPQGDGINEIFMPGTMIGVAENDYNFFIFNRWGEKIYEGHDIEDGWDGFYKGSMSQTGVYVWLVKLKGIDGLTREYRGHVNILK